MLIPSTPQIGTASEGSLAKERERATFAKVPTWNGEEIPASVLADREAIARSGIAFVTVLVDGRGRPVGPATVSTRGVLDEKSDADVLRGAARATVKALAERPDGRSPATDDEIAELARVATRKQIESSVGKRPLVLANVVRVTA